ncbi:MAG: putative manganese-dependent inorganic diphosphatase [Fusobacteriaceae bacterium]
MNHILAFGHKNPDTDSICSAISFSKLRSQLGEKMVPYRLGELSKETLHVLDYFNVKAPELLSTVSPQISDLTRVEKKILNYNSSLKEALDIMTNENFSSLPVVDNKNHLKGMIHISDIANTYLNLEHDDLFSVFSATYESLKNILNGTIISGKYPTGVIKGNLRAVSQLDKILTGDIVITTTMVDGIDRAIAAGARLIIISGEEGDYVSPRDNIDCCIYKVNISLFKTIRLISQSISIASIMRVNGFYSFKTDDYLHEIRDIMKEVTQTNFPVIDKNGEVYGTIRTKNLINFTRKKVVLLDHNEKAQTVDGIQDSSIIQVVDHHKFANFETNEPVKINAETVGSTCTIVYGLYKEANIVPTKTIAGLLMSAILSDTLIFKSPTATEKDKLCVIELAKIAGIEDYEKFGMDMLIAGTSLDDMSADSIINADMKAFIMGGYNISISQINTVDIEGVLKRKDEILASLDLEVKKNGYNMAILVITDIINAGSMLLVTGETHSIIERAFNVKVVDNRAWLEGVVSRKKQVVPFLMASIQSIEE